MLLLPVSLLFLNAFGNRSHFSNGNDIAIPMGDDFDIARAFAEHFRFQARQNLNLPPYKIRPIHGIVNSLCSRVREGAWSVLLPGGEDEASLAAAAEFAAAAGLPALSSSPIAYDHWHSLPPDLFSLTAPFELLMSPIRALLLSHTGSPEVLVLIERSFSLLFHDVDLVRSLFRLPILAQLMRIPEDDNFRAILEYHANHGFEQVVFVIRSSARASSFIEQAEADGLCSPHTHFIAANLDLMTLKMGSSVSRSCNLTTFTLFDPSHSDIGVIHGILKRNKTDALSTQWISNRHGVLWDALRLLRDAVDHLGLRGAPECTQEQEGRPRPLAWLQGRLITQFMKRTNGSGVTGRILFGNDGRRINQTIFIWRQLNGKFEQNFLWLSGEKRLGFRQSPTPMEPSSAQRDSLENKTLRVTVYLEEPFVMLRQGVGSQNLTGNDRYKGYCIDLLQMISSICRFNYTIHEVPDRAYGSKESNGKWNGMVGELLSGEADLAVASLTISYGRSGVIDFSVPYMYLGISILFRRDGDSCSSSSPASSASSSSSSSLATFLAPLSASVWASVGLAYLTTSIAIWALSKISPYESVTIDEQTGVYRSIPNQFSFRNASWFVICSLMQQGSELTPRAGSVRVATAVWWLFALILISSYTANLAAFVTTRRMATPIENADDLSRQSKIKYGSLGRGSTMAFFNVKLKYFEESRIDTYERMWRAMSSQPGLFVQSSADGIARVKAGEYAYLMESSMLEYAIERDCDLIQIGGLLDQKGYGIGMPKGSPYREQISSAILQLHEKTLLTELKDKWWKDANTVCPQTSRGGSGGNSGADTIQDIFLFLLAGISFSVSIAAAERILLHFRERRSQQQNGDNINNLLKRSLWAELCNALWPRGAEDSVKRHIDELIMQSARDGKPQEFFENSYAMDVLGQPAD